MKIISLPESEQTLIGKAMQQDRLAQKKLFDQYASRMLSICRQYVNDFHFAEDVMITGFTKAFKGINTFDSRKSFGAWLRKIMINESISHLRKRTFDFKETNEDLEIVAHENIVSTTESDAIQYYIDQLPEGYKTVFLLNVVEGYKHQEIAEMLNITEGTSKSQLHKAREILKTKLSQINVNQNINYGK
jgi:RNA polymerase sigma-70 factor (ECF subfamily)